MGAGFIGSALVWELNNRGYDNGVIADFLDASIWRNLAPLRFEDYLEADDLMARLQRGDPWGISTVFHLGACSSTTETGAAYLIRNNFEYTKNAARSTALWKSSADRHFLERIDVSR